MPKQWHTQKQGVGDSLQRPSKIWSFLIHDNARDLNTVCTLTAMHRLLKCAKEEGLVLNILTAQVQDTNEDGGDSEGDWQA